MMPKFKVCVTRTSLAFTVTVVEAKDETEAKEKAIEASKNEHLFAHESKYKAVIIPDWRSVAEREKRMGYCMNLMEAEFSMKKEDFPKALKAIQDLHGKESSEDSGGQHFSWVGPNFHKINDFQEMMKEWRWEIELDDDGNVADIHFVGEKSGDDLTLFSAIAPFVKKGSYVQMQGEDGFAWKWVFDGETCKEKAGKLVFDED